MAASSSSMKNPTLRQSPLTMIYDYGEEPRNMSDGHLNFSEEDEEADEELLGEVESHGEYLSVSEGGSNEALEEAGDCAPSHQNLGPGVPAENPIAIIGSEGAPQVWLKLKPTPEDTFDTNIFQIDPDNKTLKLIIEPEDRISQRKRGENVAFTFPTDGILQATSQDESFTTLVKDLVDKAMVGIGGSVICLGPESSGKSFTLFGLDGSYENRGLLPRAIERIFEIVRERKDEIEYHIILSMFEIRKNRIKDLLTLGPYELKGVGEFGPKGLFYEEITCIEQSLILLLRGTIGQQQLPRDSMAARPHTIVYIDILAKWLQPPPNDSESPEWRSRLTFTKIASMPLRSRPPKPKKASQAGNCDPWGWGQHTPCPCPASCFPQHLCNLPIPPQEVQAPMEEEPLYSSLGRGMCCRGPNDKTAEDINIRKDLSFLEQMFIRADDLRRINDYYNQLESMGVYMRPPKMAPSQYFRQSKLSHCLKDIVSGQTQIRVILNTRPERAYVQNTLESMRFAQRARCIPTEIPKKGGKSTENFETRMLGFWEQMGMSASKGNSNSKLGPMSKGAVELTNLYGSIGVEKMKKVLAQATGFFEEKLDTLEGVCKDQVKLMFETFRDMWTQVLEAQAQQGYDADSLRGEGSGELKMEDAAATQTDFHLHELEGSLQDAPRKSKSSVQSITSNNNKKFRKGEPSKSQARMNENSKKKKGQVKSSIKGGKLVGGKFRDKNSSEAEETTTEDDKKQRSKSKPQGVDLTGDGSRGDGGAEEEGEGANVKGRDVKGKPSTTATSMSTTLVDAGNNPPQGDDKSTETHSLVPVTDDFNGGPDEGELNSKHQCWNAFRVTEEGIDLLSQFTTAQNDLKEKILAHNQCQKELMSILSSLAELQMTVDLLEQERKLQEEITTSTPGSNALTASSEEPESAEGEDEETGKSKSRPSRPSSKTEEGNILEQIQKLSEQEQGLLSQLKELREHIHEHQINIHSAKRKCQKAFGKYCSETLGVLLDSKELPLSTLDHAIETIALESLGFPAPIPITTSSAELVSALEAEKERLSYMNEHFACLQNLAKQQVKVLLQGYPKKPQWIKTY